MDVSVVVRELAAAPQLGRQLSGEGVHPLAPGRHGRVTVSIRLESSEFTEKYSFIILATSICCYFIQSFIMKLDWF